MAADLIEREGLHRRELWPGARNGQPWWPGMPVCLVGAIAVAQGETSPGTQIALLLPRRLDDALTAELPGSHNPASFSDGPDWLARVPGGGWWLRRRVVRVLRRAAARCRRG